MSLVASRELSNRRLAFWPITECIYTFVHVIGLTMLHSNPIYIYYMQGWCDFMYLLEQNVKFWKLQNVFKIPLATIGNDGPKFHWTTLVMNHVFIVVVFERWLFTKPVRMHWKKSFETCYSGMECPLLPAVCSMFSFLKKVEWKFRKIFDDLAFNFCFGL